VKILLSNGVVFENENGASIETARRISDKAYYFLDLLLQSSHLFRDKRPS